jgi:gag-polypeptide of LTR copia-type
MTLICQQVLEIKALKHNDDAMAALVLSVTDTVIGQLFVGQSKSKDFPCRIAKKVWKCLKEHYTPKDSMALQMVKQELINCFQNKHQLPTDYIAHLIGVQNKFTVLGKVLEDKEVVMQYAFAEYMMAYHMMAYQRLKCDADNKNEIVMMYMILTEMSSLYLVT